VVLAHTIRIRVSEPNEGFIKRIAFAEVARVLSSVSASGMRSRERRAAKTRELG
jgi:hypothetical protein